MSSYANRVSNNNRSRNTRKFTQQRPQQQRQKFCTFCKKLGKDPHGHFVKECKELQKIKCKNCGKNGHTIRYCPFIEKCQFCERVGHTEKKCFYNPANKIARCPECKAYGHSYDECRYVSKEDKKQVIKKKKDADKKEKQKVIQEQKTRNEFRKKGITDDVCYLKLCKKEFEKNASYIPWIIFCDSDEDDESDFEGGLNEKEQKHLDHIKYQITLLD